MSVFLSLRVARTLTCILTLSSRCRREPFPDGREERPHPRRPGCSPRGARFGIHGVLRRGGDSHGEDCMLALWLGDFPDSSCRLAGKLLTEKSSSHFPAVPWQDKMLNPSHRIVLEAKEQVANGFPGRWRPHSCSREPFALLAAGTTPRRLPSALECLRNGDKAFKITTVTLKTRATFCVVRQGGRRGGSRRPEGGHPPPGAGSPRAGEQGSAPGSTPRPPSKPGKEQDAETSRPGKLCFSNPRGCGVKERTGVSAAARGGTAACVCR